jgi:hypothetical protein
MPARSSTLRVWFWRTSADETQVCAFLDGRANDFGSGEDCVERLLPDGGAAGSPSGACHHHGETAPPD